MESEGIGYPTESYAQNLGGLVCLGANLINQSRGVTGGAELL